MAHSMAEQGSHISAAIARNPSGSALLLGYSTHLAVITTLVKVTKTPSSLCILLSNFCPIAARYIGKMNVALTLTWTNVLHHVEALPSPQYT
jgi:hypothetical protein